MALALPSEWTFDHIGVVVKSLSKGQSHFTHTLGAEWWTDPLVDQVNGVALQFCRDQSGIVYELLSPMGADSPIASALAGRKNLLNHVAYRVSDLTASAAHLRAAGSMPTAEPKMAVAFGGALIQFFVTPINTIIELIEAPEFTHEFRCRAQVDLL
ncbi:VOC family protein [Sphingomonas asaccharolytica]|uniref:VOC family protein n=1 Tax=Sphingomonas asaccharolytica TaxID=40681 RepID=UPI0008338EB2|nr:VOC family protein [Sphingomonas asaccharolytica]